MYINKLADIISECNNTNHSTTKMKPADVESSIHVAFGVENNCKDPRFEVGDHVRISK